MEEQNVKVLLLNIKAGIVKVESGNYDLSTLEDIRRDFLSFLDLLKLFLISMFRTLCQGHFEKTPL